MHYLCLDVRSMKAFGDNSYDFIIDKGTLDCLFCEEQFMKEVLKALMECWRVLKGGAKMVVLSHGGPKFRMYLFRNKLVPFHVGH
jgi:predicted SAM-dependent methyltransferase